MTTWGSPEKGHPTMKYKHTCPRGCPTTVESLAMDAWHECSIRYRVGDGTHSRRVFCDGKEVALEMIGLELDTATRSVPEYEVVGS